MIKKTFVLSTVFLSFFSWFLYCGSITISYKGLDNVHLEFSDTEYADSTIILKVQPGNQILFSQKLPWGGGTINGKYHHTGLSSGTYTYQLYADSELKATAQVTIDGKIGGTLLYDETIGSDAELESDITVPENKSLTVNGNLTKSEVPSWNRDIRAYGTLSLSEGIFLNGVNINFYNNDPVSIKNIKGVSGSELIYSGASDTSVENCEKFSIRIRDNASLSVKNSKVTVNLYYNDVASLTANNSTLFLSFPYNNGLSSISINLTDSTIMSPLYMYNSQNFFSSNCVFTKSLSITGGNPQFQNCEFVSTMSFNGRNEGSFTGCVFGSSVEFVDVDYRTNPRWADNSSMQPNFSGCSFVGRIGPIFPYIPPAGKVNLGSNNYFGDKSPDLEWFIWNGNPQFIPGSPQAGWFLKRGVPVNTAHFELSGWSGSGPQMQNQKVLPAFWVNDYVVGQNCLGWPTYQNPTRNRVLLKGRETLLSLDVATNYENVSGVRFKAIFDGQEIQPVNPNVILRRDISGNSNDVFYGNTTVNFILPSTEKDTVGLMVTMDTTGITGFDEAEGKGEGIILNIDLSFQNSYSRQLNILVQPIQLYITGYTRDIPDGKAVENSLKKLIPAMLPISKQDLHIWTAPTTTFYGGVLSMFSTTALLNRIANYLALAQGFINTTAAVGDWVSGNETARVDFVVAVLPHGVLSSGTTGANLSLRRGIIFVDESSPDAALHEIGHGIGLYTGLLWGEQYDQFPPAGLPVEGITAFINEPSSANSIDGFRNRFLHFPRKDHSWYEDNNWYDIMGSSSKFIWPIWTTFSAFRAYFQSTLGEETKSSKFVNSKVPEGYKRIFVSAETEKTSIGGFGYKMIPGTIKSFDITEIATGKIDVPVYWADDNCSSNDYGLKCFDQQNNNIYTQAFTVVTPYPSSFGWSNWPEESSFCGTFDIPENTKRYAIYPRLGWFFEENPIFEVSYSQPDPITITSPSSGIQLSDSVEIKWMTSETKQQGTMQYVLMISTDGGSIWIPAGAPVESNKITIPTDFLSSSDNIIFKVIGSSGLGTTSDQVDSLVIENRPPQAVITSPQDGWTAQTGTKWLLTGYGIDNEDGTIPDGVWTSSIDGQLNTETDVVLSPGIHTLTFTVRDSGNLTDSESVVVEVKEMGNIDLSLDDNSLSLSVANRDPLNSSPVVWLTQGGIHRATLRIRNTGIDTIFKASLYLTAPSSQEQLLASNYFAPEAFEEIVLSETFIVSNPGQYQIRAEITDTAPQDTNPSNNQKIWTYQTQPQSPVIGVAPDTLDFGTARARKQGLVLIQNYGNANLSITSLTISGQNSAEFSIDQSILQTPIPANTSIFIPAYFSPASTGTKQAILTITSNDPENPMKTIEFTGSCFSVAGDISNDSVVDISDVILCLRQAIGLDPQNPDTADMNEDGSIDISDVILILRKAIGLD